MEDPTPPSRSPTINWTIDGIDFIPHSEIVYENESLTDWCRTNGAVMLTWNTAKEHSPCYSDGAIAAKRAGVTQCVMVGYNDPNER